MNCLRKVCFLLFIVLLSSSIYAQKNGTKDYPFFEIVKKDGKFGMVDKYGEEILPFEYDQLFEMYTDFKAKIKNGFIFAQKGNLKGILNNKGETVIPIIYTDIVDLKDDAFAVSTSDRKHGILNGKGEVIAPIIYDAPINSSIGPYRPTKLNGQYGCLNKQGEILLPFEYQKIERSYYNSYLWLTKDDKTGFMDTTGQIVLPLEYEGLRQKRNQDNTYITFARKDGKLGVLDENFQIIIPHKYYDLERTTEFFYRASVEPKIWGVLNTQGEVVLDFVHNRIHFNGNSKLIMAKKPGENYSIYNERGEVLVAQKYYRVKIDRNYVAVQKEQDGKYALINTTGKEITDFIYDHIYSNMDQFKRISYYGKIDNSYQLITTDRDGQD